MPTRGGGATCWSPPWRDEVSGIITDIKVDFNSRVTNGQIVAQIDPSTYNQNITSADADLANAKAVEELAEVTMKASTETVLTGDDAAKMQKLLDALDDLDDVQDVYTSAVIEE